MVVHSQRLPGEVDVVDGIEIDETMDPVATALMDKGVRFETRQVADGGDPTGALISVAEEVDAGSTPI